MIIVINSKAKPRIGKGIGYHEEEFNLSNKRRYDKLGHYVYSENDVKEFIRLDNIIVDNFCRGLITEKEMREERIKLAGDKLI